jgi:ABC-type uncharacterized transport system involved in gliding motility auxiliary subunit
MKKYGIFDSIGAIVVIFVILVSANLITRKVYFKVDMTSDKLYTLSSGTKSILSKLSGDVKVNFYYSESFKDAPAQIKSYGEQIQELLREFADVSGGRLKVRTIDPKPDTEEEEWARKYGVEPMLFPTGENFYMGAVFISGYGEKNIPQFDPMKQESLEYDLIRTISLCQTKEKKRVGILSNFHELFGSEVPFPMPGQPEPTEDWFFIKELKESYDVVKIGADSGTVPDVDLLVVIHPVDLPEKALYAIDQFVVSGRPAIICVDPSAQTAPMQQREGKTSDLSRLFKKWGISYNNMTMLADMKYATRVRSQMGVVRQPTWLSFTGEAVNKENVGVAHLNSLLFIEPGSLGLAEKSALEFTPLLSSSEESGLISIWEAGMGDPETIMRKFKKGSEILHPAAVYSGVFESSFEKAPEAEEGKEPLKYLSKSEGSNSILVIADADFLHNNYTVRTTNFLGIMQRTDYMNENLPFFYNMVESFSGDPDLISIRTRGSFSRPFTRVDELLKTAHHKWKEKDEQIAAELREIQSNISQMEATIKDGRLEIRLTKEQQEQIERFRERERELKREQREVRKKLREDIEDLGVRLTMVNLLFVPLLLGVFGAFKVFSYLKRGGR